MKKFLVLALALSTSVPALAKSLNDRKVEVPYVDLSDIMLHLYSETDAERNEKKRRADHMTAMLAAENKEINAELDLNKTVTFKELTEFEALSASFKAMRFLRGYRSDPSLLYSAASAVENLEFFKVGASLFSSVDKTETMPGRIVLGAMLTNPLVDIEKMETRKELLTSLIADKNLFSQLDILIKDFKKEQNALLSYWSAKADINALIEKKLITPIVTDNPIHDSLRMSLKVAAGVAGLSYLSIGAFYVGGNISQRSPLLAELIALGYGSIALIASVFIYDDLFYTNPERRELALYVHKRTVALAKVLQSAEKIQALIEANPSLQNGLKNRDTFKNMTTNSNAFSAKFNSVKTSLMNPIFATIPNAEAGYTKTVLKTDVTIRQILPEFASLFETIGEVDAYLAIARLVINSENSVNKWCLVDAITNETEPKLELEGFWHPSLDAKRAISNEITFKDGFRGMILTGTNTGGKSTTLKSILLTAIDGQGWGIAPARKVTLTPFSFLGSFINVTDSIADKASLFEAENDRARALIDVSKDVARHNKFGIVVMDELFKGTDPVSAAQGDERVANKLFLNKNLVTLFATHHSNMTTLESKYPGEVNNFKMDALLNEKGRYVFSYKISPGISTVSVAEFMFDRDL